MHLGRDGERERFVICRAAVLGTSRCESWVISRLGVCMDRGAPPRAISTEIEGRRMGRAGGRRDKGAREPVWEIVRRGFTVKRCRLPRRWAVNWLGLSELLRGSGDAIRGLRGVLLCWFFFKRILRIIWIGENWCKSYRVSHRLRFIQLGVYEKCCLWIPRGLLVGKCY